jgi:hypothetical protein
MLNKYRGGDGVTGALLRIRFTAHSEANADPRHLSIYAAYAAGKLGAADGRRLLDSICGMHSYAISVAIAHRHGLTDRHRKALAEAWVEIGLGAEIDDVSFECLIPSDAS